MLKELLAEISNEELQLLLFLYFGDGSYNKQSEYGDYAVNTNSIHLNLLEFKLNLITNLKAGKIKHSLNPGYNKNGEIYNLRFYTHSIITKIYNLRLSDKLDLLDELGVALWFYDDGSLHKHKLFYNLCTHSFTVEDQQLILKKLLKFNINGHLLKEQKTDGRIFYYISINKFSGAYEINKIMSMCDIKSMSYKLWSEFNNKKYLQVAENYTDNDIISKNSRLIIKKEFMKLSAIDTRAKNKLLKINML